MFIKDYFSGLTRYLKNIPKKCPERNFVCGWFDEKDYFEFRPADVVLKMEKVEKVEIRKYIPRF